MNNFDLNDPTTWVADDEMLWLHKQFYRKFYCLVPNEVILGAPNDTKESNRIAGVKNTCTDDPHQSTDLQSESAEEQVYRIEGVEITKEELLKKLEDIKRSVSQEYHMRENGDTLGELEEDWHEGLLEFLTPEDLQIDEEDTFTLWTAKQHFKLDMRTERRMNSNSEKSVLYESGSSRAPGSSAGSRGPPTENKGPGRRMHRQLQMNTSSGVKKKKSRDEVEEYLKELRKEVEHMKVMLPKLKQKCLKLNKACRIVDIQKLSGDSLKNDVEQVIKDIKILNTIALRYHQ